jgi:signal peptidase I
MNDLSKKAVSISNDLFFQEVKELLGEGKKVSLYVQGDSMRPFLKNGDKVLLTSASSRRIKKGAIILARSSMGIVLHRVIQVNEDSYLLAGDAHSKQVEKASVADVIGIVVGAHRYGKEIHLDSSYKRFLSFLWGVLRPFRGLFFKCYDVLHVNKVKK